MDKRELCHPYRNEDGKLVTGAAAFNHYVFTEKGGIQNYHNEIGEAYINHFVNEHSDVVNEKYIKDTRRKKFKRVV